MWFHSPRGLSTVDNRSYPRAYIPPPIRFFSNFSKTIFHQHLPFSVAVHILTQVWWGLVSMVTRYVVTSSRWSSHFSTSSPRPSPCPKWRIGKTPGQGCWNTPRIVEYFVMWHNRKPLFKRSEDISSCLRDEVLTNFWNHFGSLAHGFLQSALLKTRRRPWGRGWPFLSKFFILFRW